MNKFTRKHIWPITLEWTDLLLACLGKQKLELILDKLEATNNKFVVKVEKFSNLIQKLACF